MQKHRGTTFIIDTFRGLMGMELILDTRNKILKREKKKKQEIRKKTRKK